MSNEKTPIRFGTATGDIGCHKCSGMMRRISWKITAGAHDAGKEVEQIVFECPNDKNTITIETTTGEPSEFAVDVDITYTKL